MAKAKIRVEREVPAELHAYPKVWNIHVNLVQIAGVVVGVTSATTIEAPDGEYDLHYQFAGKKEVRRVRVERGDILA